MDFNKIKLQSNEPMNQIRNHAYFNMLWTPGYIRILYEQPICMDPIVKMCFRTFFLSDITCKNTNLNDLNTTINIWLKSVDTEVQSGIL